MNRQQAEIQLQKLFGFRQFHNLQWQVIENLLSGRRVLFIKKTGFGKSLCFQFPATQLQGVTIVFSPLIGLAMARNAYIYGLAKEIYVAESDSKGGTWEGAMDGLKRGRKIYVRYPEPKEKNANLKLVELGALAVNMDGEAVDSKIKAPSELFEPAQKNEVNELTTDYENGKRNIEKEILEFLNKGTYTSKEILLGLKLDWYSRKLTSFLKKNPNVKTVAGKPAKFTRTDVISPTLFG